MLTQLFLLFVFPASAANVTLASLFWGSSVVLQAGNSGARVWGSASPGASVRLTLDGAPVGTSVADASGRWETLIPEQPPSWRVLTLRVADDSSDSVASLRFGTVMLCSGQSNMELPVGELSNGTEEVAGAGAFNGRISLATLQTPRGTTPSWNGSNVAPQWNAVSPGHGGTLEGFSGLCWLSGRALFEAQGGIAPVGLMVGAVGGTPIEAWLPVGVLGSQCPADTPPCSGGADSSLYNSFIHPFAPTTLGAVLWDQGERDVRCFSPATNRTAQYPCMERSLVITWREAFKSPAAAFAAVQLPGYLGDCSEHGGDYYNCVPGVFNMRLAQEEGLSGVANASAVVTYDLSCPFGVKTPICPIGSVHNLNKTLVAARAARALLAQMAPAAFPPSGASPPRVALVTASPTKAISSGVARGGWTVTVTFDVSPLQLRGTQYCEMCCAGGVGDFDASVDGIQWVNSTGVQKPGSTDSTVVFNVELKEKPSLVRYTANQAFPQCAVVSIETGLPAAPFQVSVQ